MAGATRRRKENARPCGIGGFGYFSVEWIACWPVRRGIPSLPSPRRMKRSWSPERGHAFNGHRNVCVEDFRWRRFGGYLERALMGEKRECVILWYAGAFDVEKQEWTIRDRSSSYILYLHYFLLRPFLSPFPFPLEVVVKIKQWYRTHSS